VFVVGHLGDWRRAAAVLFERHSLSGHPAPRREARESVAGTLGGSSQSGGFRTTDLDNNGAFIPEIVGQAMSEATSTETWHTLCADQNRLSDAVAFMENQRAELRTSEQTDALARGGGKPGQGYAAALAGSAVRRLTPRECERLQGFPDDYTLVPYRGKLAADGPRYKALGNSMAVPVMCWIGERIAAVEALQIQREAA
jgi:DNA (cytosine-5)-methyltransferase 1